MVDFIYKLDDKTLPSRDQRRHVVRRRAVSSILPSAAADKSALAPPPHDVLVVN